MLYESSHNNTYTERAAFNDDYTIKQILFQMGISRPVPAWPPGVAGQAGTTLYTRVAQNHRNNGPSSKVAVQTVLASSLSAERRIRHTIAQMIVYTISVANNVQYNHCMARRSPSKYLRWKVHYSYVISRRLGNRGLGRRS